MTRHYRKWTDQDLISAFESSGSMRQILIKLRLAPRGGNYETIKRNMARLGLDKSKFPPKEKHLTSFKEKPIEKYLVKSRGVHVGNLRRRLIKEGVIPYTCFVCGISEWRGKQLVLDLDHINGVNYDHRIENLRFLCPNCHSQTPTYRGKNTKK